MSALFLETCLKIWNLHVYLTCSVYILPLLKVIKKTVINMMVIMSIEHIAFIFQSWTVTIVLMLLLMCHCECANFSAFYKSKKFYNVDVMVRQHKYYEKHYNLFGLIKILANLARIFTLRNTFASNKNMWNLGWTILFRVYIHTQVGCFDNNNGLLTNGPSYFCMTVK